MRIAAWLSCAPAFVAMAGCSSLYLHDPGLAARTAEANEQLGAAKLVEPFTAEEGYLAKMAADEDKAAIDFQIARRDYHVALIIESPQPAASELIRDNAKFGLRKLTGRETRPFEAQEFETPDLTRRDGVRSIAAKRQPRPNEQDDITILELQELALLPSKVDSEISATVSNAAAIERSRADYTKFIGGKAPTCKDVQALATDDVVKRWNTLLNPADSTAPDNNNPDVWRARMYRDCNPNKRTGEIAASLMAAATAAISTSDGRAVEAKTELDALIAEAKEAAKNSNAAQLAASRQKIAAFLETLQGVAKLAGWEKIESEIAETIRGEICASGSKASAAAKAEAKCSELGEGDTAAKAVAVLNVVNAAAKLNDVQKLDGRNANWMVAAAAIANANTEHARIEAAREKAEARHLKARAVAVVYQAAALACARLAVDGAICEGRTGYNMALSYYVDSWNDGATPAYLAQVRADREERVAALRQARAAADRQVAMIGAAAKQAKLYGEGGIKPDLIARLLGALALVSIAGDV